MSPLAEEFSPQLPSVFLGEERGEKTADMLSVFSITAVTGAAQVTALICTVQGVTQGLLAFGYCRHYL